MSLLWLVCLLVTLCCLWTRTSAVSSNEGRGVRKPNFIVFLADDMGWGDLSVYGHPTQEFEAVDKMAAEGVRFTQWYSPASVCTPSRAATLTGRQPFRTGVVGPTSVLLPGHNTGLPHSETTLAEALSDAGYTTGIVGKWHLGINKYRYNDGYYLPHTQGFHYVGTILPFTLCWACDTKQRHQRQPSRTSCFLYQNTTIVEQPIKLQHLTSRIVHDAKSFIHNNVHKPFFLYMSLPQTHTPMFNRADFNDTSKRGVYGDQINEMSLAVEQVLDLVRDLGLHHDTLAVFLSDHGPHVEICQEGGSSGPFRGGKGSFREGGLRVPAVAWWPGVLPHGAVSHDVVSSMDLFPTLLHIAGGHVPIDRVIDGRDIKLLASAAEPYRGATTSPSSSCDASMPSRDPLFFYCDQLLIAMRVGAYKIYYRDKPLSNERLLNKLCDATGIPMFNYMDVDCISNTELESPVVYNVEQDPAERWPLPSGQEYDRVVELAAGHLKEEALLSGDVRPERMTKKNLRSSLIPCCQPPYCFCNYSKE